MESLHVGSLGKNSVLSRNSRKSWVCMCHPGPRAPLSRALWGPHWTQSMLGPTLEPSRSPVWTRGRSNPSWKQSAFIAPTGFVSAVHVRQRRKSPAVSKLPHSRGTQHHTQTNGVGPKDGCVLGWKIRRSGLGARDGCWLDRTGGYGPSRVKLVEGRE